MLNKKNLITTFFKKKVILLWLTYIFGIINSVLTLLIPISIGKYYELVFHNGSYRGKLFDYIPINLNDNIHFFFVFFICIIFLKFLFNFFEKYFTGILGEGFSKKIREQLFAHQLSLPLNIHNKKSVGKYLLRYSGDFNSIQNFLTKGIIQFRIDIVFVVLSILLLSFINFSLSIVIFCAVPIFILVSVAFNRIQKKISIKKRNTKSGLLSFVNMRLSALTSVKVFNREKIEVKKFIKKSDTLFKFGKKFHLINGIIFSLLPTLLYLMLTGILIAIYYINKNQSQMVDGGILITYIILLITIFPIFRRSLKVGTVWQSGDISFSKLLNLLNHPSETLKGKSIGKLQEGKIDFKNVSFGYTPGKILFENLSFTIQPRSITKLTGTQSKGKSSIFNILLKLYPTYNGEVLLDGVDIQKYSPKSIRKLVTLVSDDATLLGNTIFEAVSYSRKPEKREETEAVLKKLKFKIKEEEKNEGILDHKIGDMGKNLSASQKKILQIARALLTKKKILLLDEPFVGLDQNTKYRLVEILNKIKEEYTIIIIDENFKPADLKIDYTISL